MSLECSRRNLIAAALSSSPVAAARARNPTVPLGKTGLEVTRLGFGCEDAKDPAVIRRAVDLGITYFNAFGNLELTGRALKPVRDRVVLAAGSGETTAAGMLEDLSRQLRTLGTDYIDLWYLLSKYKPEQITNELVEALRRAKKDGKIRACATAGHGVAGVAPRLLEVREVIGATMVVCNFATWDHRFASTDKVPTTSLPGGSREDIVKLHKAGIGILSMKPMMGGLKYVPEERQPWAGALAQDEKRRQAALSAALKWVLQNPYVDSVPVRASNIEHLEANARSAAESFTEGDHDLLAAEVERMSPYYCRMCRRCEGSCQQSLPVSDVLRYLMYAEGYDNLDRARHGFRSLPPQLQQVRCDDCDACSVRCPNGVMVRERVARAQILLA